MPLVIGILLLVLVVFFSTLLGLLIAASIGIKRNDRGRYRALRDGGDNRSFSGAGRTLSGLCFPQSRGEETAYRRAREDGHAGDGRSDRTGALL